MADGVPSAYHLLQTWQARPGKGSHSLGRQEASWVKPRNLDSAICANNLAVGTEGANSGSNISPWMGQVLPHLFCSQSPPWVPI